VPLVHSQPLSCDLRKHRVVRGFPERQTGPRKFARLLPSARKGDFAAAEERSGRWQHSGGSFYMVSARRGAQGPPANSAPTLLRNYSSRSPGQRPQPADLAGCRSTSSVEMRTAQKLGVPTIHARLCADPDMFPPKDPETGWTIGGIYSILGNPKYTAARCSAGSAEASAPPRTSGTGPSSPPTLPSSTATPGEKRRKPGKTTAAPVTGRSTTR
jgi:hypothetical protein